MERFWTCDRALEHGLRRSQHDGMKSSTTARILRVNHGGEHGAISIYSAQIVLAAWRGPELLPFLKETLGHEVDHRARFAALMPARNGAPCRLMWLWGLGGSVLGGFTGLVGRQGVMVCTEAVERAVHRHLEHQLHYLDALDSEAAAVIRDIQVEELQHLSFAEQHVGRRTGLSRVLDGSITALTELLIWLSTQGDSTRLARDLAQA
jgi:ubiquinone biosynthesis monooxygenase Coq7